MIDFKTYYKNEFQKDLLEFLSLIPEKSKYHYDKNDITIQYFTLTPGYDFLNVIDNKNLGVFSVSLYWTILSDQITFTRFKKYYNDFHSLTLYPKFIGNCTGTGFFTSDCGHHQDPSKIFVAINDFNDTGNRFDFDRVLYDKFKSKTVRQNVDFKQILIDSVEVIKFEIKDFFENHLNSINWIDFLEQCDNEMNKIKLPAPNKRYI